MDFKCVVDKLFATKALINLPLYEVHNNNDIVELWTDFNERMKPKPINTCPPRLVNADLKFALNQHVVEISSSVIENWNEYGFFDTLKNTFHDRVFALVQKYATITVLPDEDIDIDDSDIDDTYVH